MPVDAVCDGERTSREVLPLVTQLRAETRADAEIDVLIGEVLVG